MLGLGKGGACNLRGEGGRAGRTVEEAGTRGGRSVFSRGFVALEGRSHEVSAERNEIREERKHTRPACAVRRRIALRCRLAAHARAPFPSETRM